MYRKHVRPQDFGFANLDAFLQHLESVCHAFLFRPTGGRIVIKLDYVTTNEVDSKHALCEALPVGYSLTNCSKIAFSFARF
jgi:hypothetical protein